MGARQDQFPRHRAASASFPLESRGQYGGMEPQPMPSPIRTDMTRPAASTHARSTYTPGYVSPLPFSGSGGASAPNTRLLEPRDHMPQFGYNTGGTPTTPVHGFPSQPASEGVDHRPFYPPATHSAQFKRPGGVSPHGETAEESGAVKRE